VLLRAAGTGTTHRRPRAAGARRRLLDLLSRASPAGHASHFAAPRAALPRVPPRPPLLHPKIAAQGQKQEGESEKERRAKKTIDLLTQSMKHEFLWTK